MDTTYKSYIPVVTGSFTGTGQSSTFGPMAKRGFNFVLGGGGAFSATIQLERYLDSATGWQPITANGTQLFKFTAACSEQSQDDEPSALYRWNCTAYTSGTIPYRISQ